MRVIVQSKNHSVSSSKVNIIPPVGFKVKAIYLTSASIPYTFYNIRNTNNSLTINGTSTNLTTQNYNSLQLANHLQSLINSIVSGTVTVVFNKQSLKYTITTDTEFTINFGTAYKLFGFNQETFTVSSSITSNFVADINDGIHSLILTANFATPFSCLFNESFGTNIIARIPLGSERSGDMINYTDENNQRPIVKNIPNLQFFEISLLDDDLKVLDLNGVDFQVELFMELDEEISVDMLRIQKKK